MDIKGILVGAILLAAHAVINYYAQNSSCGQTSIFTGPYHLQYSKVLILQAITPVLKELCRGGGTGPADPAAAGPIIYSEIITKDDLTT